MSYSLPKATRYSFYFHRGLAPTGKRSSRPQRIRLAVYGAWQAQFLVGFHGGTPSKHWMVSWTNPIEINGWWLGVPPFWETYGNLHIYSLSPAISLGKLPWDTATTPCNGRCKLKNLKNHKDGSVGKGNIWSSDRISADFPCPQNQKKSPATATENLDRHLFAGFFRTQWWEPRTCWGVLKMGSRFGKIGKTVHQ